MEKLKEKKILSESLSKSQVSLNTVGLCPMLCLWLQRGLLLFVAVLLSLVAIPKEPLITMSALLKVIIYVCIKYICIYIYSQAKIMG